MNSEATAHYIVRTLRARVPGLHAVYLYGSRGRADDAHIHPGSDYDLAFYAGHQAVLDGYARFTLAAELAAGLHVEHVDLVELGALGDHLLLSNILDGTRLWAADPDAATAWEASKLTQANDFFLGERAWRAAEIADIRARVRGYRPAQES